MREGRGTVFFVMGVSGCGKSTVGRLLAKELELPFFDGDDYHPKSNIDKMSKGKPLDDNDRLPWLQSINRLAMEHADSGCVIACSALKVKYRKILVEGLPRVFWIFLKGDYSTILERIKKRSGHFMPEELLRSQFDALELPDNAIHVTVELSPPEQVDEIIRQWESNKKSG
ncbi:gluconokinase [Lentiprolixibacter aurantiacus]|uniref:Gluconokinase n=1 Tax=Lentiprolixibacter aurantiacus TaxID=2993939 RepID=A0AAE3ML22_9FLAO|nr:gluconokinase [Lentiprolixibacter aurantiacus]MCX2719389.1 gluconokinase [Lentiprolixibacter aurantiacus]